MAEVPMLAPGDTIGILGGGQLGRMLAMAAAHMGLNTHIYTPQGEAVAGAAAHAVTHGAWDDAARLAAFASHCRVVTYEFENVPVDTVDLLAGHVPVRPGAAALTVAQDRICEKDFVTALGGRTAPYAPVDSRADLSAAAARLGAPAILKTRRMGYDGKGQARIARDDDAALDAAWDSIGRHPAVLEGLVDFAAEFSVILARGADGALQIWDSPHNVHAGGILASSTLPAPAIVAHQQGQARELAAAIAAALDYVGVMTCEFFAHEDGPIFNELAPRPHNSGHWTIEGAVTSQFANHIRAVAGWPLGSAATRALPVTMRNLIGGDIDRVPALLADPDAAVHHYGKAGRAAGRKLGHVTWAGTAPGASRDDAP